jgi:malate dehydrogenase (oxaloacetate-decarboxylating)
MFIETLSTDNLSTETLPVVSEKAVIPPDPTDPVFALHAGGKLEVVARTPLRSRADLALAYTPGVAEVCLAIAADPELLDVYTGRGNTVAVVSGRVRQCR